LAGATERCALTFSIVAEPEIDMASQGARREADLFWSELVGRARGDRWPPQVRMREEADLFLNGLRGR
jgi:hypothetical protein